MRGPLRRLVLLAGALAACGASPAPVTPQPAPSAPAAILRNANPSSDAALDAQAIFRAARKAWSFINYSRYATYTIAVSFRNGSKNVTRHYDTIEDVRRGIVFTHTFSHEEIADPSVPHGVNFAVGSLNGQGGYTTNADNPVDPIGPLALAINFDFGISLLPQKTVVVDSTKDIQFPPKLPVIGTTSTVTKPEYTVRLIDVLDHGKTYHLGLEPLTDPGRLRLRQMWVSAGTYAVERILIAGNFSGDPYEKVPWLIEFRQQGGAAYIDREIAEAPLDFDGFSLPNVEIAFEDVQLLGDLPRYGAVGANDSSKAITEP